MTIRFQKRNATAALIATVVCLSPGGNLQAGNGGGIFGGDPRGPVFKTLDVVAGGIESVLERTVLAGGKAKRGHSSPACDDACDAATLHQLNSSHHHGTIAVPMEHQPPTLHKVPMVDVEPQFDQQPLTPHQAEPDSQPRHLGRTSKPSLPLVPVDKTAPRGDSPAPQPQFEEPNLSSEDGWIDSFAPGAPNRNVPPRRAAPAADDALPDPFRDDPQSRLSPRSDELAPQPKHSTVRKTVKSAGYFRNR